METEQARVRTVWKPCKPRDSTFPPWAGRPRQPCRPWAGSGGAAGAQPLYPLNSLAPTSIASGFGTNLAAG